jgi:hypothetical protein
MGANTEAKATPTPSGLVEEGWAVRKRWVRLPLQSERADRSGDLSLQYKFKLPNSTTQRQQPVNI